MSDKNKNQLWPFKKSVAFLAVPLIWLFFIFLFISGKRFGMWQNEMADSAIIVVAIISCLPVLLVLLDFFILKKAIIDIKGIKFDFSKIDPAALIGDKVAFALPDNIGIPGAIVTDSAPMNIINLDIGGNRKIVVVNIKSGNAWWVTRLVVLCAGAVRTGSPEMIVFLCKKNLKHDYFLGWGEPRELLNAIISDKPEYRARYEKSTQIAKQFLLYKEMAGLIPALAMPIDAARYLANPQYMNLHDEVTEHILLDQLGNMYFDPNRIGSLEEPPDRINTSRLNELFDHCLYKDVIDLNAAAEDQINQLLNSTADYLALVKNNQYFGILKKSDGENLILKELVLRSQSNK